jgi:hypothetical protein
VEIKEEGFTKVVEIGTGEVLKLMFQKGLVERSCMKWGFEKAFDNENNDIFKVMLDYGMEEFVNEKFGTNERTLLRMVSWLGLHDNIIPLLELGAHLEARSTDNSTPFHYACSGGNLQCISVLMDRGVNINAIDNSGHTGLHIVSEEGHTQCLPILIEKGMDIDLSGENGRTPLYYACENNEPDSVKLLLQHGAEPNLQNANGETPLAVACEQDHLEIVETLLGVEGIKFLDSEEEEIWNRSLRIARRFLKLDENKLIDLNWKKMKGKDKLEIYNFTILGKLKKFVKEKKT